MNDAERTERLGLAGTLSDLGQTALAALEAAELLGDQAERRVMAAEARALIVEMVLAARRFAGLPETGSRRNGRQ